jgi:auxin efflux carrier family protein
MEYMRREDTPRIPTVPQFSDPEAIFNSDVSSEAEDVPVPAWSRRNTFPQRAVCAGRNVWRRVTGFMTPPLWASVASLVVALNQPIQHFIGTHLWPLRGAITQAGNCMIPLTLLVLGAYFHTPPDKYKLPPLDDDLGSQRATPLSRLRKILCFESESRMGALRLQTDAPQLGDSGEGSTIFAIILARMFIAPLLFLPLVVFCALRGSPGVFKECVLVVNAVVSTTDPIPTPVRSLYSAKFFCWPRRLL